jgi:hypothetical protein
VLRLIFVLLATIAWSSPIQAGPKEDAQAAYDAFFPAFVAGNNDQVAGFFAPDALFYGTLSPVLVTTPEGVSQYFKAALSSPVSVKATSLSSSALALSDSVVLISGSWQVERVVEGKTVVFGPYRISAVMNKRGDRWMIAQFHNSPRPAPPAPAPVAK